MDNQQNHKSEDIDPEMLKHLDLLLDYEMLEDNEDLQALLQAKHKEEDSYE